VGKGWTFGPFCAALERTCGPITGGGGGVSAQKSSGPSPGRGSTIEWASVLAALPDPLFILEAVRDPDGTVVELVYAFLNEAAARLYGMSVDEVVGHGQCELFPTVKELGIWDSYLGVIESGSPETFDVPYFNENGVEGSFRLTATKLGDGLLISANDTTEQVKAEKALGADRAGLQATVDSLLDPAVRFEAVRDESGEIVDFVYVDANPAACAYDQMTHEELVGSRLLTLLPGHVGTGLLEMCAHVVETGEPLVLDDSVYPQELMGGEERHHDIRAARVGDGLTYTWRDVTDRHVAERRLRAIYDSMLDPHILYEAIRDEGGEVIDLRLVDANLAACEYNRLSRERLIGSTIAQVYPGFINDPTREAYAQVLATGEPLVLDDATWGRPRLVAGQVRHLDVRAARVSESLLSVTWRDSTERQEAADYANRMAAVVEQTHDAIIGFSFPDTLVTSWNPGAERMYGYTAEEVIGKSAFILTPKDQLAQAKGLIAQLSAGEPVTDLETVRIRTDGTRMPVSMSSSPIRDAKGETVGFSSIHRDITVEKEAREYANQMAAVVENSGDAIVGGTPEGIITSWNPAAERMYGYTAEEIIGTSGYKLTPEHLLRQSHASADQIKAGQQVQHVETERLRKGGTVFPASLTISPVCDADGALVGISAIHRDLTEQKEAARLTRSMIEAGLDSMVSISPEGIITDANQAMVRLTGVPRDKLIGTSFSGNFTEPDKAEQGFQQALEVGSVTDYPLTLCHHDGKEWLVEVQYNAATYRDVMGGLLGVFAVARDVTEQLQAQQEIAEHDRERARLAELEEFHRLTLGRELKMIELKKEINDLKKYGSAGSSDPGEGFET
jgi:PAS domain S-box-containing protein